MLPAGVSLSFSAQFNSPTPGFVAMSVYDDSGSSPTLVQGPSLMVRVVSNIYRGKYTATAGKPYIVVMAVYTDGTFVTPDLAFTEVTTSFFAQNVNPPVQGVVGIVNCNGGT